MRDVDTKQEIGFYLDKVYIPGEDCSENVAEVAAVLPNQPPLDGKVLNLKMFSTLDNPFLHAFLGCEVLLEGGPMV